MSKCLYAAEVKQVKQEIGLQVESV